MAAGLAVAACRCRYNLSQVIDDMSREIIEVIDDMSREIIHVIDVVPIHNSIYLVVIDTNR